jgi:hypothetical protein
MPRTAEQNELVASLARRSERLAGIYDAGLCVLYQEDNHGRLPLVAHSMRELIEKCPTLTGRQPATQGDNMKNRFQPVKQAYLRLKGQGFTEASPLDAVEGAVREVMGKLDRFLEWMEENRPQLEKRTAQMLGDLSGPGPAVPIDIFNDIVARWLAADQYFKDVAHHQRNNVNDAEFVTHMTFIETFLLQRLQPRAIADQDAIDALISEAEHGQ